MTPLPLSPLLAMALSGQLCFQGQENMVHVRPGPSLHNVPLFTVPHGSSKRVPWLMCRLWNHLTGEQLADLQLTHPPDSSTAAAAGDSAASAPAAHSGVPASAEGSSCQLPDASVSGAVVASGASEDHNGAAAQAGSDQHAEQEGGMESDADEMVDAGHTCQQPACPAITTLGACTTR
jgi:hypothetical protein